MFPVRYELGFYIPEDSIFNSDGSETLKSYLLITLVHICSVSSTTMETVCIIPICDRLFYLRNCVFWDVTPYGSCKNGRFGGT
jgi:hypothetical protein